MLSRDSFFLLKVVGPFFQAFSKVLAFLLVLLCFFALVAPKEKQGYKSPSYDKVLMPNHYGRLDASSSPSSYILALEVKGEIGAKYLSSEQITHRLTYIKEHFKDHPPKALLLLINTPGGVATEGHAIYRSLQAFKDHYHIPVYAYVDGLCASAAFYPASCCDKVYATSLSLIGSIGAKIETLNYHQGMQQLGVHYRSIESGKNKSALHPFLPPLETDTKLFEGLVHQAHEHLVNLIQQARPQLSKKTLVEDLGANLFSAYEAEYKGLIDGAHADYPHVLKALAEQGGIVGEYRVVKLDQKVWDMPYLIQGMQALSFLSNWVKGDIPTSLTIR